MDRMDLLLNVRYDLQGKIKEIAKADERVKDKQRQIDSGMFDLKYVENVLRPELKDLQLQKEKTMEDIEKSVLARCEDYKKEKRLEEVLNPEMLTDDIRLLQTGVVLSSKDVQDLLERNSDNPTMSRLLFAYAEQNGLDTGNMMYQGKQELFEIADAIYETSKIVLRHWDSPQVFEQLLSDDSNIGVLCIGGDE